MPRRSPAELSWRSVVNLLALAAGFLAGRRLLVSSALAQGTPTPDDDIASLQPGQFFWHPERAPEGPVAIIVSIPKQLAFVYRNGILIGVSTCSTGKPGHSTPAGVFTVLQKAKVHTSATYGEPMPDMEGSRSTSGTCPAIRTRMAAFTCRQNLPTISTPSRRLERR
jgi:hypothetical protein